MELLSLCGPPQGLPNQGEDWSIGQTYEPLNISGNIFVWRILPIRSPFRDSSISDWDETVDKPLRW